MLKKHGLTLAVRANDQIVICEREFHNGVKTGETAVTREHLLDEDARVARAKR